MHAFETNLTLYFFICFSLIKKYIFYTLSFGTALDKKIIIDHNHSEKQKKTSEWKLNGFRKGQMFRFCSKYFSKIVILYSISNRNFRMSKRDEMQSSSGNAGKN